MMETYGVLGVIVIVAVWLGARLLSKRMKDKELENELRRQKKVIDKVYNEDK
ncbi:MAG: hypothetical protein LBU17_03085 [Treponema sp.]|jgi:hypothetical protein|nr:hypothetical protein [Treponema sp.]